MNICTTLKIGSHHTNHCEDYLLTAEIGKNKMLCAVMDGCSMGTDSYFAATLTGKLLRKICREISYKEFLNGLIISVTILMKTLIPGMKIKNKELPGGK
jgi:hypothetical protein